MKVLSIDLGATSGRIMVVNYLNGFISYEEIFRFQNVINKRSDNSLHWDIKLLINNIIHGIKEAFNKHSDIASIGVDSWGVDYLYIDARGNVVDDPYCYRDPRTITSSKKVLDILNFKTIYDLTGIQYLNINTIYQLYDDVINRRDQLLSNADKLMMIPDYVAYCLTGQITSEITILSTMSILDVRSLELSEQIINALGIKPYLFPSKVVEPGQLIGYLHKDILNLKRKIPVYAVCSHDTSSAVLATPISDKSVYISSGTWSLIGVELKQFRNDHISFKNNFTNELGYKRHFNYLKNVMGTFIISELRKDFEKRGDRVDYPTINRLISEVPEVDKYIDGDNVMFYGPGNMLKKIQNYLKNTGQSNPTFPGQYYKLVYQSMACKYRYTIDQIKRVFSNIEEIIVVGGGNQSDVLNQYTANVTGIKVIQGPTEATVYGNALVQLIAMGQISDEVEGRKIISQSLSHNKTYLPKDREIWEKKYNNYLNYVHPNGDKE